MQFSNQQVEDIQEIEKQLNPGGTNGPKVISQTVEKDRSTLMNLLIALGITVGATVAIVVLLTAPFGKKKMPPTPVAQMTTNTQQVALSPNITVTTEYVNPFSQTAQYSNPFTASQNPFDQFTQ